MQIDYKGLLVLLFAALVCAAHKRYERKRRAALSDGVCSLDHLDCDPNAKFRSQSGSCNNLLHPLWGKSERPFKRLLSPAYDGNGSFVPRGGLVNKNDFIRWSKAGVCIRIGSRLANPRLVSSQMMPDFSIPSSGFTNMYPTFGQFLSHDISLTGEGSAEGCCEDPEKPECFPVPLPSSDSFYSSRPKPVSCMEFTRSMAWCPTTTTIREQVNLITSYLDASFLYGSTEVTVSKLRSFEDGKLLTTKMFDNKEFLPVIDGQMTAGDGRANEWAGLTAMHVLFLREHNRLASEVKTVLADRGSAHDDEAIYQLTRKLFIAEWTNIVYSEFLPVTLGADAMQAYELNFPKDGNTVYDPTEEASAVNVFATVAFRQAHSMIPDDVWMVDPKDGKVAQKLNLLHVFFAPGLLTDHVDNLDKILLGLITQPSLLEGQFFSDQVKNFLFPFGKNPPPADLPKPDHGRDLGAIDIQRGRDHGIPGYNEWRKLCNLTVIPSMSTLDKPEEISFYNWNQLRTFYAAPEEIDLIVGIQVEKLIPGALAGPTSACIMGLQFKSLLKGDRFFFTHGGSETQFNQDQLNILKKRKMRDIMCENLNLREARENVFTLDSPILSCNITNKLDLNILL